MKTEKKKTNTQGSEEDKAWRELWKFANESISVSDISINYKDFVEEGKKLFEIKERHKS